MLDIYLGNQCILIVTPIILNFKFMTILFSVFGFYLNEI